MEDKKIVMKFGGSSVSTTERIKDVAQLIIHRKEKYNHIIVVVSAMGDTTDNLLSLANRLSKQPYNKEIDMLLSSGEIVSASLLAMHLIDLGYPAQSFTGFQAGLKTRGQHRKSQIENINPNKILEALSLDKIVIVADFQGMNAEGEITTLGRGGSDTSAVALAAKLNARCEIYTDVAGIYTVDPRIRPNAKKLKQINYEEALEMANLGAKVIAARSVELAAKYNVPLYIALNTGNVEGTCISNKEEKLMSENMEEILLTNISKIDDVLMVNLENLEKIDKNVIHCFVELADANINVDLLNQMLLKDHHPAVSFTAHQEDKDGIITILDKLEFDYLMVENLSKVSIIGSDMRHQVGVAAEAFRVFVEEDIPYYMVSTSDISISYVVDTENAKQLINAFADRFGL